MNETKITGLEALIREAATRGRPPVELWNPPHCGDIGMRIASDGTWFYAGSPIGRHALVKLFASVLRRDKDGQHYLVTPVEKIIVAVDDAPFLAVEMEVRNFGKHDQALVFRTNLDDIVMCSAENPLRFTEEKTSGGLKPYVLVRGRLEALVTRAVYYDLVELARPASDGAKPLTGDGVAGLHSCGAYFPLTA